MRSLCMTVIALSLLVVSVLPANAQKRRRDRVTEDRTSGVLLSTRSLVREALENIISAIEVYSATGSLQEARSFIAGAERDVNTLRKRMSESAYSLLTSWFENVFLFSWSSPVIRTDPVAIASPQCR